MPGHALTQSAAVMCVHAGQAQPTTPLPRVTLSGAPAIGQAAPYTVAGCPFVLPGGAPSPCVTATWVAAALRVTSGGIPSCSRTVRRSASPTGPG